MPDSGGLEAEPGMQLLFSVSRFAGAVLLAVAILNFSWLYRFMPNRVELGPRTVPLHLEPVAFEPADFAPLQLAGAWELSADDPRFGGWSAIAATSGGLVALNDSGVLFRFPRPGAARPQVHIDELPAGPGSGGFKYLRDSEGLLRDPGGRGWWVAFENRTSLWLFDDGFRRALGWFRIPRSWPRSGFEAIAAAGGRMLLIPESGGKALAVASGSDQPQWVPLPAGPVSDARALPDGSLLLVERKLRPDGLHNRLVQVRRAGDGYAVVRAVPLGVGRVDNVEGVAIEPRRDAGLRLWLVTDDGHQWPQRTLLIALDWPQWRGRVTP